MAWDNRCREWRLGAAALALAGTSCLRPSHIVLTIEDPEGYAGRASILGIGSSLETMSPIDRNRQRFPMTAVVTIEEGSAVYDLWVEAYETDGSVLARGFSRTEFRRNVTGADTVKLLAPCDAGAPPGAPCAVGSAGVDSGICIRNHCVPSSCGDGFLDETREACDDGNQNPNDACADCRVVTWERAVLFGLGEGSGDPLLTPIGNPLSLSVDRAGNVYFFEIRTLTLRRFDPRSNKVTRLLGPGKLTFDEPGSSIAEIFLGTMSLAVDGGGNIYMSDVYNHQVSRLDATTGELRVVAGTGSPGFRGDGQAAMLAELQQPMAVAVDGDGNLYVGDRLNFRVRRVDQQSGVITTVAGNGTEDFCGEGGPAVDACLGQIDGVALDRESNLFILDDGNRRIRRVDHERGMIQTVAGDGDANPSATALGHSQSMALAPGGDIFITIQEGTDGLRRLTPSLTPGVLPRVETIACTAEGFSGEDAPASQAACFTPWGVGTSLAGDVYFADSNNHRIRRVGWDAGQGQWTIDTVVGNGDTPQGVDVRDLRIASPFLFRAGPGMINVDLEPYRRGETPEHLYVADAGNHQILRLHIETWDIDVMGGTGERGFAGDGGPALAAQFAHPRAVAVDSGGQVYVADRDNHCVRVIDTHGIVHSIAGTTAPGYNGDFRPAASAHLHAPTSVAFLENGDLLVADTKNHRIRRIEMDSPNHLITTLIGNGTPEYDGDYSLPNEARVNEPTGMFSVPGWIFGEVSPFAGDLVLFADRNNHRVRAYINGTVDFGPPLGVTPLNVVVTLAGNGGLGYEPGDIEDALDTPLEYPRGVFLYPDPECTDAACLMVADGIDRIRLLRLELGTAGIGAQMSTLLGGEGAAEDGEFSRAKLRKPELLVGLAADHVLVADRGGAYLRSVRLDSARVATVGGFPEGFATDSATAVHYAHRLRDPRGFALDRTSSPLELYISEGLSHTILKLSLLDVEDPATWTIVRVAGQAYRAGHVDGPLAGALFDEPAGLAFDSMARILYVAQAGNHTIRAIHVDSPGALDAVDTIAGIPGQRGFHGDSDPGYPAREALFNEPTALAIQPAGLYVADTGNHRVRLITNLRGDAVVETVVGDGVAASSGVGAPARLFPLDTPRGLALDTYGNLFITSRTTVRLVAAGTDGVARGDDAVSTIYGTTRATFPENVTRCLSGIVLGDDEATVYVADACQGYFMELGRELFGL